ncbi:MAG: isochorismatase family protein [Alphaproteobacteria bacterium]|nr:isochorismatase family protein [Alphaproteobacteria bacterium]
MATALIIIDVQKEYQQGGKLEIQGFDLAAGNISKLLIWGREGNADIFHVRHISTDPSEDCFLADTSGIEFATGFEPHEGEGVFTKFLPSAFSADGFKQALANGQYSRIIICGFSSFLCCDSTVREAYHKGYNVIFVDDAIGEFAFNGMTEEQLHTYACAVMGLQFATVLKTRNLVP